MQNKSDLWDSEGLDCKLWVWLFFKQIKYHADFEKMKGKKLTVVDDPEMMRIKQNTAIQSNVEYHKVRDQLSEMEQKRPDREARGRYQGDREPVYRSQCVCVCGGETVYRSQGTSALLCVN